MSFTHSSTSSLPPAPSLLSSFHPFTRSHLCLPLLCLLFLLVVPCLTGAQYTSKPYVSPNCLNSSFLLANKLSVPPSGSRFRPTITLERDGWAGHWLTTSLAAQLLRDALGYSVAIVDVDSTQGELTNIYSRLAGADGNTSVMMNFEVWPSSQQSADYNEFVTVEGTVVSAGPLGLVQQSGWYVPTALVNQDWNDFYDFWKGYKYDTNLTAVFPPAGSTADYLKVGAGREFVPSWCVLETEPAGCNVSLYSEAYLTRQCNVTIWSPYCIEMYAIDAELYDPGVLQQQITNLQLNITVVFLGEDNYSAMKASSLAANRSFLAYDWTPAIDTSVGSVSRVALPGYTDICWYTNAGAASGLQGGGALNCDFPIISIFKFYSASLSNDTNADSYRDALYLLGALNFANQYQQYLLVQMNGLPMSQWQATADKYTCEWLLSQVSLWKSWVSLSPQQYYEDISSAAWIAVIVIVSVLGAYSLLLHAFVYRYRNHPLLLSSSPFFGQVIIGGSWFLYVAIAIMRWKSVEAVCSIIPTFLCIAYTLVIGTLFAKTWRLNRIFKGASLKSVRVSAWDVVLFISVLFTIDFIIIAAWLLIDRPVPVWETDSTNSLQLITVCYSQHWNVWYSLLIVPKALEVFYGMYLAYNVRHINANFNESRYIGLAIVHLIVFAVIVIPLDRALQNQLTVHYLLVTLMLCLGVFVTLSLIFIPKVYAIVYKRKGQHHKRPARAAEDSKSDAAHNNNNNNNNNVSAGGGVVGYRWMRERVMADVSESDKLSFPSLHGGGFVHAVRIVRLVAEQLYRECGIGEYWQFCVAIRNMSQQELEARAPLLVAYLQQHVALQQQKQQITDHKPTLNEAQAVPHSTQSLPQHQQTNEEERKTAADVAVTDVGPLSQDMSVMADERSEVAATTPAATADDVVVEMPSVARVPVEYSDYPITQQSFSFAPSALALRHSQSVPATARGGDVSLRQSVLSEDSCYLVSLPPLPADAWTMTDDQIHRLTLPGLPSPLASPISSLSFPKSTPARSSSTSTLASQMSPSSALSPPALASPLPLMLPLAQSFASQASFSNTYSPQLSLSTDHPPHSHPAGPFVSIPSPSESSVPFSSISPTSPANHHSTTDSGGSDSGSIRSSAVNSDAAAARSKAAGALSLNTSETEACTP